MVRHAAAIVATQAVGSVAETQSPVQVLVRGHAGTGQGAAPLHPLDLQSQVLKADSVIAVHRAFELQREDALQIVALAGHKGAAGLGRFTLKLAVELSHVVLPQETIGLLQGGAFRQPQLLGQASLPVPKLRSLRPRACGE